jgi:hypothetical protein
MKTHEIPTSSSVSSKQDNPRDLSLGVWQFGRGISLPRASASLCPLFSALCSPFSALCSFVQDPDAKVLSLFSPISYLVKFVILCGCKNLSSG